MEMRRNSRAVAAPQTLATLWVLSCFLSSASASLFDLEASEPTGSSQTAQQLMRQAVHRRFGWKHPDGGSRPEGQLPGKALEKGSAPQVQGRGGSGEEGLGEKGTVEGQEDGDRKGKGGEGEEEQEGSKQWRDLQRQHEEQQLQHQEREAANEGSESDLPDFPEDTQLRLIPAFVYRNYEALAAMATAEIESEASAASCPFDSHTIRRLSWCRDIVRKYYLNSFSLFEKLNMFACDNLQLYKGRVLCLPEGIEP